MKLLPLIMLLFSLTPTAKMVAQTTKSENLKPQWLHKLPQTSNSTFVYETDFSVGKSLNEARSRSLNGLITSSGLENGVIVVSDYQSNTENSIRFSNGKLEEYQEDSFSANNHLKGNEVQLHIKNIAEYWTRDENGNYSLTTLYAKAIGNKPSFDEVELTTKYGVTGLWRSLIIPGWGQFYKGSNLKGGLILGGTVAFIGGIIYTETMRKDYMNKISKTHNADNIRSYKTRADNFAVGRNICIGGLAALYAYNIVDAIVAPGARRIVVKKNVNGRSYSLMPSFTFDGSPAMCAQITF
ncbi:MAG: hypothetical protein K2M53_03575 [Muribaculaceae bacterium]|nr:hypothetical protein [Muribaculaceae bacterium]